MLVCTSNKFCLGMTKPYCMLSCEFMINRTFFYLHLMERAPIKRSVTMMITLDRAAKWNVTLNI